MNEPSEPLPDTSVLNVYRTLNAPEPSTEVDRAVLERARTAIRQDYGASRTSPSWVWPLATAAALILCVGLFLQIADLIPRPRVVVMEPQPIAVERYSPPPVGAELRLAGQHGTMDDAGTGAGIHPRPAEGALEDEGDGSREAPPDSTREIALAQRGGRDRSPPAREAATPPLADLRRKLDQALADDDAEAFRRVLETIRSQHDDFQLSPAQREWALQHGLRDLIH